MTPECECDDLHTLNCWIFAIHILGIGICWKLSEKWGCCAPGFNHLKVSSLQNYLRKFKDTYYLILYKNSIKLMHPQ